ncbi:MAG: hypothetical protein DRP63_04465 [Planctomycetota bacterium]|nr:MAG: hypothetical protein DRP63_04465 [Planctomycetota bacterium]
MRLRCSSCGSEVPDGSRYCPLCGAPLLEHTALTLEVADPNRVLCDRYIILDVLGRGARGERRWKTEYQNLLTS